MLLALSPAGFAQITKGAGTAKYEEKLKLVKHLIGEMTIDEKIDQLTNVTQGIKRLGIKPYNWWSEVLHGVARNGRATETLQLYVSAPTAGVASPIASLIGFKRVELQVGQTVREEFEGLRSSCKRCRQAAGPRFWRAAASSPWEELRRVTEAMRLE